MLRGRAGILSRRLWQKISEGGHGEFVRFLTAKQFNRRGRKGRREKRIHLGGTENGNLLDPEAPLKPTTGLSGPPVHLSVNEMLRQSSPLRCASFTVLVDLRYFQS